MENLQELNCANTQRKERPFCLQLKRTEILWSNIKMSQQYIYPTYHSLERSKLRVNTKNADASRKRMQLAYDRGKRAEDFTSWERNYLLGEQKEDNCIAVAYNQHCYIFRKGSSSDIVCITMYPLPNWFGKKKAHYYHKNERVKNMRRIAKETEAASRAHQEATVEGIAFSHD